MKRLLLTVRCEFIYFSLFFTPVIPVPRGKCVLRFVVIYSIRLCDLCFSS